VQDEMANQNEGPGLSWRDVRDHRSRFHRLELLVASTSTLIATVIKVPGGETNARTASSITSVAAARLRGDPRYLGHIEARDARRWRSGRTADLRDRGWPSRRQ
jgi:hypothetical protein